jgi:hypothetical protein
MAEKLKYTKWASILEELMDNVDDTFEDLIDEMRKDNTPKPTNKEILIVKKARSAYEESSTILIKKLLKVTK